MAEASLKCVISKISTTVNWQNHSVYTVLANLLFLDCTRMPAFDLAFLAEPPCFSSASVESEDVVIASKYFEGQIYK